MRRYFNRLKINQKLDLFLSAKNAMV